MQSASSSNYLGAGKSNKVTPRVPEKAPPAAKSKERSNTTDLEGKDPTFGSTGRSGSKRKVKKKDENHMIVLQNPDPAYTIDVTVKKVVRDTTTELGKQRNSNSSMPSVTAPDIADLNAILSPRRAIIPQLK